MARRALLIAHDTYEDGRLTPLADAVTGAVVLKELLQAPEVGAFDKVDLVLNQPKTAIETDIERFYQTAGPNDLALLYFAGHVVRSEDRRSHLIASTTNLNHLTSSAISPHLLRRHIAQSAASNVALLDCDYSRDVGRVISQPEAVVIAASSSERHLSGGGASGLSGFTAAIVKGLSTGEADFNADGIISINDLWEYLRTVMPQTTPAQSPMLFGDPTEDILIAKTRRNPQQGATLPSWPSEGTLHGPPSSLREHVDWVDDAPAETDLLQRQALAQVLATRLVRVSTDPKQPSFLIHVDGPWGSGKSTLLKLLEEELTTTHLVVPFNAWRHARVQPPWWSLLTTIRDRVIRDRVWIRRPWSAARETWARARRSGAPYFLAMLITAALLGGIYLMLAPAWTTTALKTTATAVTAVAAAVGVLWAVSKIAVRLLLWNSARGARLLERSHTDPMGEVSAHFGWLIRHSRRPVVIFIDDLDRCDGPTVVDILEAIQTLARDQPAPTRAASFVIAADGAWLRRAYEDHYASFAGAVDQPGQPLGYLFQEKLFQLSVPVPAVSGALRASYLSTLLGGDPADNVQVAAEEVVASQRIENSASEAEVLDALKGSTPQIRQNLAPQAAIKMAAPDVEEVTRHSLEKFAPRLQANPRGVKRFLNTYSILRTLRTLEGNIVATDTLATWALLRSRWPQLADHLEQRPQDIGLVRNGPVRELPRPLRATATSPELQAFLRTTESELTEAAIRSCCGDTSPDSSPDPERDQT